MPLIKDSTGTIHQKYGACEECGKRGRYVRAVRVAGSSRPVAVYACKRHSA